MKALLVEDELILAMYAEEMLSDLGVDVIATAATLQQGLSHAMKEPFDIAVLDINLNGTESYPIADALIERSIPFIFASGYSGRGINSKYMHIVAVQKPYTSGSLELAIARAIESKNVSCLGGH